MIVPEDLHPDDTAARHLLAGRLRRVREGRSITQAEAGERLGCNNNYVSQLERYRTWKVATVQAWARIYDYRLNLTLTGLSVPDDGDPVAAMYDATQPGTAAAEDRLDLRIYVNNLVRIRVAAGITLKQLGVLLGCSESAACRRESHADGVLVSTLQQHTRALGGALVLDVVPAWQGVPA